MLSYEQWGAEKLSLLNSVSIGTVCDVKIYNKCSKSSLSILSQARNCFPTRLLPCRQHAVRSQPRNWLFGFVMALLLLWQPRSWF